ncbi:hypothetical protein HPB48_005291 [Haemaphysalis longicornis]|uniref:ATPase AAA-type core domain-containing protein n=1 Tax=Haemaphysalis longicornis TaxID=44386 RepID=A0A9J6GVW7_HAELO|nr:hypothetical protein HPB48_005291 [Haemaphysalis longicornis]
MVFWLEYLKANSNNALYSTISIFYWFEAVHRERKKQGDHGQKLIILDEPTTGQDPESKRSIWDLLQSIRNSETSLLISSHDMEEADLLADRIIIMAHGKIIGSGSASFLKKACSES